MYSISAMDHIFLASIAKTRGRGEKGNKAKLFRSFMVACLKKKEKRRNSKTCRVYCELLMSANLYVCNSETCAKCDP